MSNTGITEKNNKGEKMTKLLGIIILIGAITGIYLYLAPKKDIITESAVANKPIPLANGTILTQNINIDDLSTVNELQIQFGTYKRTNTGTLNVALLENDNEVAHWEISMESLIDNAFQSFKFENAIKINPKAHYVLKISENYEGKNAVAVWSNDSTGGEFKVNDEIKSGTICYKLIGK